MGRALAQHASGLCIQSTVLKFVISMIGCGLRKIMVRLDFKNLL